MNSLPEGYETQINSSTTRRSRPTDGRSISCEFGWCCTEPGARGSSTSAPASETLDPAPAGTASYSGWKPPTQAPERPDRSGRSCKGRRHPSAPRSFPPGRLIDRRILPAWPRSAPRRSRMRLLSAGSMSAWAGRLWPAGACGLRADARRAPGWAAAGGTGGGLGARLEPRPRPRSRPGRRGGPPGGGVHGGGAGAGPRGRRRAVRHQRRPRPPGTGVGRTLLAAAQAELTRLGYTEAVLWVLPNNASARRFYEVASWITDGIQRTSEVLGVVVPEVRYRQRLQDLPSKA
jgi:hypothetical protein